MRPRLALRWGLLGLLSGNVATLAIFVPHWLSFESAVEGTVSIGDFGLFLAPVSVLPGMVFGLVMGVSLRRNRQLTGAGFAGYVAAAALSYFLTVQLTVNVIVDVLEAVVAVGIVAGLFGGALLAAATAALIADFRDARPTAAMLTAGTVAGAALHFAIAWDHFLGWLLLFAPWQAAYAAAMATAPKE